MRTNFCKIIFFSLFAFTTLTISACSDDQKEKQQQEADKAFLSGKPPKFTKDTTSGGFNEDKVETEKSAKK